MIIVWCGTSADPVDCTASADGQGGEAVTLVVMIVGEDRDCFIPVEVLARGLEGPSGAR